MNALLHKNVDLAKSALAVLIERRELRFNLWYHFEHFLWVLHLTSEEIDKLTKMSFVAKGSHNPADYVFQAKFEELGFDLTSAR